MRRTAIIVLLFALLVATYVTSMAVSTSRLIDAARAGDGEQIWARTDLNRVKRALAEQITDAYLERAAPSKPTKSLGVKSEASLTDAMLSKFLTARNLKNLLQIGTAGDDSEKVALPPISKVDARNAFSFIPRLFPISIAEIGLRLSEARSGTEYSAVSFAFDGTGWKLSTITLPKAVARGLAENLPGR